MTREIVLNHPCLVRWQKRRDDPRVERHWKRIAQERPLNGWELHQQKFNFIEAEYSDRPSNNGLDSANPDFAYATNLAKFIVIKDVAVTIRTSADE